MRDNQGSNTMRDTTFSRRDMLWAGGALTVGAAFAEPLKAAAAEPSGAGPEPPSWVDSAMPEVPHRIIETNGIRLHCAAQGEGPLAILMPRNENGVFYHLFVQSPEADAALGRDIRRTVRSQLYSLSGDRPPSAGGGFADAGMVPRKGVSLTDPASLPAWVTESDIDVYVAELARSGFRGPLAWYRNVDRSWELLAPFAGAAVTIPALYIAGDRDFIVAANSQF